MWTAMAQSCVLAVLNSKARFLQEGPLLVLYVLASAPNLSCVASTTGGEHNRFTAEEPRSSQSIPTHCDMCLKQDELQGTLVLVRLQDGQQ